MSSPRLLPQQQSEKEELKSLTGHVLCEGGLSSGRCAGPRGGCGRETLGGWNNVGTSSAVATLAETVQLLGKRWHCRTGALGIQYILPLLFSKWEEDGWRRQQGGCDTPG